jgi:hypothetical protein
MRPRNPSRVGPARCAPTGYGEQMRLRFRFDVALVLTVLGAASFAACGGGAGGSGGSDLDAGSDAEDASLDTAGETASDDADEGGFNLDTMLPDAPHVFDVQPAAMQILTVPAGTMAPVATFTATLDGVPVNAAWSIDRGDVGSIPGAPASSASFTPLGTTGGLVTVTAGLNGQKIQRQVFVKLTAQQDGANPSIPSEKAQIPTTAGQLTAGGGVGGVGGEGLGPAVGDAATKTALGSPAGNGAAQGLKLLYPYDKTVFPRGLLAPLLQWEWVGGDADAIKVELATSTGSFSWTGTFGRPVILGATGKFIRMPIPQDVWDMASNTAAGKADQLTVKLTVAKGGLAYGPIASTWTIAPARLSGSIYYNSYGTQLAQNYPGAIGGTGTFGGAVLSIRVGDTGPKLVAGKNGVNTANCRVCHSVAADGSRLVVQHGENYGASSAYDLAPTGATEKPLTHNATYPAIYPDGSMALTEGGLLLPLPTDTTPIAITGLGTVATDLGQPMFSPDGKMIAFNPQAGAGVKPGQTLYAMAFAKGTYAFSGATLVADDTGKPTSTRPGWPAFFPDSKSLVYHHQTVASSCDGATSVVTRSGARAQIYWTDLAKPGSVTPLDQLNGVGYLPKLAAPSPVACNDACGTPTSATMGANNGDHSDDANVNYEPTVAPIAAGGYAWVVFTSRRRYGNVATIGSFCSDPRGVDLFTNITPKKLWVAAIDLSQAPGTDSSHPAFYLPAQELLAGNARAFWVLDPCRPDAQGCTSGDQCCNGYCQPNGAGGALVCSNTPPDSRCSQLSEKCTTPADCCDTTNVCVNGFCAIKAPQ